MLMLQQWHINFCCDVFVLQEPYMEGVNPFIKNNKQRMIMFLDELGVNCPVSIFKAAWVACSSVYELCVKYLSYNILSVLFLQNVPDLPESTEHFRTDLSRDLAALHEICATHSDELRTLSNERGAQQVCLSHDT